jgi:hypothetical protein
MYASGICCICYIAWHVSRHALRLVIVPGLTIKCAWVAITANTRWNRHARRDAALGCVATVLAWSLVEAAVWYWQLEFPWTWPIIHLALWCAKHIVRLVPLPFFVLSLQEIFGQRAREVPCLLLGLFSTMAVEWIYWMFNIQTPLLDPIQSIILYLLFIHPNHPFTISLNHHVIPAIAK